MRRGLSAVADGSSDGSSTVLPKPNAQVTTATPNR